LAAFTFVGASVYAGAAFSENLVKFVEANDIWHPEEED
jgi:hypothetical protein